MAEHRLAGNWGDAMRKRNSISGQWSARPIEMLESPAYRALTRAAHLVISRIEIELAHHGGNDNGRLPVTFGQFVKYGLHRTSVAPGIRVAEALGFIRVTERGRGGNAEHRSSNKFYVTFATWRGDAPTHEWRKIKTPDEAEHIATEAQAAKNELAVAIGTRSSQRRNKTNTGSGKRTVSVRENVTENASSPVRVTVTKEPVRKTELLSISGVGGTQSADPAVQWSTPLLTELPWNDCCASLYRDLTRDAA
jgi:hypothetical protein